MFQHFLYAIDVCDHCNIQIAVMLRELALVYASSESDAKVLAI
jgi:hypothetical protein